LSDRMSRQHPVAGTTRGKNDVKIPLIPQRKRAGE
jgi:hypothetical protein